ncbi:MAG: hypothetical protein QXX99_05645 [Candidatus Bathyarchaeia archaeon]
MEAVKSYGIPVEAPKDLIEEYFKVKQKADKWASFDINLMNVTAFIDCERA